MTIISTKPQLMQFFSDTFLEKTARRCGFMERFRNIGPQPLVLSLIAALSKGNCTSIADLHRQFNGMCLSEKHTVAYKPFHNQLRKSTFADFMKTLVTFAMVQLIENVLPPLPKKFEQFDDILLQDGGSFNVHPDLAGVFPCRFSSLKAAVECHMTLSLFSQSLNPLIVSARNGQGRQLPTLAGKKLRDISRKNNRDEVLDFTCRRGRFEFRVIRRWFAQEKRFCFWLTNLPPSDFTADDIMALYRCRWQVELLFKELKSHTNRTGFATGQKAIAEGLIWASLLALIVRRSLARRFLPSVSFLKAAKNVDVWLLPILGAIIHHAGSEIEHHLDWALKYLSKNALKLPQRKSDKDNTLEGIVERLNA